MHEFPVINAFGKYVNGYIFGIISDYACRFTKSYANRFIVSTAPAGINDASAPSGIIDASAPSGIIDASAPSGIIDIGSFGNNNRCVGPAEIIPALRFQWNNFRRIGTFRH